MIFGGARPTCDSAEGPTRAGGRRSPHVRGPRGAGSGGTRGLHVRGGPRSGAGRAGGRGESLNGTSWTPARTWHSVALHPTQYPTRLTKGKNTSFQSRMDAFNLYIRFLATRSQTTSVVTATDICSTSKSCPYEKRLYRFNACSSCNRPTGTC